jgi:mannose-6-phosphate isomerase-like protein (cupin superfamily)
VAGHGLMTLGESTFGVGVGDTICIPPGTPHCIVNTGERDLCILCCCAPAYDDRDTDLL